MSALVIVSLVMSAISLALHALKKDGAAADVDKAEAVVDAVDGFKPPKA